MASPIAATAGSAPEEYTNYKGKLGCWRAVRSGRASRAEVTRAGASSPGASWQVQGNRRKRISGPGLTRERPMRPRGVALRRPDVPPGAGLARRPARRDRQ